MEQSAKDIGCKPEDFLASENMSIVFTLGPEAKKYYKEDMSGNFISYGNNTIAAVSKELLDVASEYVKRNGFYDCFESPIIYWLNERIRPMGQSVFFMSEFYLPDLNLLKELPCEYEMRILEQPDFEPLYLPEWSNALCKERKHLDVLGVGAYDGDKLVGFAACSADAEEMWQIGVDVLPEYRRKGIASAVTSKLALEIFDRGKIPFYCSAWSNIRSVRNAVKSGFIPAWIEMSIKPISKVEEVYK